MIHVRQAGTSLVELLVALLVFSFGVLGTVALQARAMQFSVDAEDRNRAAVLADEIVSTMWLKKTLTLDADVIEAWRARVGDPTKSGLPDGEATLDTTDGVMTVTITWKAPSKASSKDDSSYVTQVAMP